MNNIKRYLTQRNRNIIAIIIIILGVGYLAYYSFFSPTYINSYIASNIYKTPANSAFKDETFYQCVVKAYNSENKTSVAYTTNLSDSQLQTITTLNCSEEGITDASGLEKMTALEYLYLFNNKLTSLDVSKNTALSSLYVYSNQLTSLDVSNNQDLHYLYTGSNQLTSLDVRNNPDLHYLYTGSNQLTSLDVRNNPDLYDLDVDSNQLTSLDLSNNLDLYYLSVSSNQLISLDVSNNQDLHYLYAYSNQLTSLDVSNNTALTELYAYSNQLTNLDVSNNTALTTLKAYSNQLTSLDLSNNLDLYYLYVSSNQLTSLDLSNNLELYYLSVSSNQLTSLGVSHNPNLHYLYASSNQLTSLDLSNNPFLQYLYVDSNQLTSLDVSTSRILETLDICHNPFNLNLGTIFKNKATELTSIVKLPTSLTISSSTNEVSNGLSIDDNIVTATDVGEQSIVVTNNVGDYSYSETYYVNVIDLTSDVYDIDVDKDYIFVNSKDKVLDNIVCSNCDASIEDNYLVIKSNEEEVKRFKLVTVESSVYDINDDYIYVGNDSNDTIINNLKVMSGASIKIDDDNNLVVEYNDFTVSYKLVRYSSETYDLFNGYIYTGLEDIDLDNINIINGNKEIKDNNLVISYNDNVLETIPIVRYSSEAYDLSKGYIYTGFEDIDLNNIIVINGNKEIKDNNLIISYNNNELDKIPVYSLKMNNGSIRVNNEDKIIYIKEESISSSDFIDSIDFNSDKISIGIYDNDVLVEEFVKVGYVIKVSIDLEEVDSYEVLYRKNYVDYYNTDNVELNVSDNNDIIKNIAGSSTFDNLVKLVDTDGVITIKNSNNEELSDSDTVKTGDRLEVTLTDYTHLITLSVRGDVTGRGLIDNEDVLEAYEILKNRKEVEKEYYLASDIDRDGKLKISDVTRLYRYTKKIEGLDD